MDFMKYNWDEDSRHVYVTLVVKDYPVAGVTLVDLVPKIQEIRQRADSMTIKVDLHGAGLVGVEKIRAIIKLCIDVTEYTREDDLLRQIHVTGAGFLFRMIYAPISVAIPKYFRDMIVFL
jgi:hypothetical protein